MENRTITTQNSINTSLDAYSNLTGEMTVPSVAYSNSTGEMTLPSVAHAFVMNAALRNHTVLVSSLMFASGVLGNVVALALMATSPIEQRRTMFYKLMAGLAVTDLFGTCATSPVVILTYATGKLMESHMPICQYFSFMMIFAGFASMSIVCAMSIERYICVCHPYAYHCKLPKSYSRNAIAVAWIFSAFIACLPFMGVGSNAVQIPPTWCFINITSRVSSDSVFNYIYAVVSLVALSLTFVCNVAATVCVMSLRRRQNALSAAQRGPGLKKMRSLTQRVAEVHMVVMLLGVTIIFTMCYGPLVVFVIICQTSLLDHINFTWAFLLIIRFASFNQILDPWVYILVRRELRWKIISMFRYVFGIKAHRPLYIAQKSIPRSPSEDSQISMSTLQKRKILREPDMTFLKFCFHCLCDPPVQRSSTSLARASTTWNGPANRSPSAMRRLESVDSLYGSPQNGCIVNKQPTPSDELLLVKLSRSQTILDDTTNGIQVT